jgi:hypothetical protein
MVLLLAAVLMGIPVLVVSAQDTIAFVVNFLDASGAAVTDVTASEIAVVENGVPGTVVAFERDTRALDVTMLVDNSLGMGTALGEVRSGAKGFFAALPSDAQVSLVTLAPQPRWVLRPTIGPRNAVPAVDRITPDSTLGRFLDALVEAGDRLSTQSRGRIPVLVVVVSTNPDDSGSREQHFKRLAQRIAEHAATVHAVVVTTQAKVAGGRVPGGVVSDIQVVIGSELAKLSGGRYEQLAVSSRVVTLLPELGQLVTSQSQRFRLRARRPESAKGPLGSMAFGISRPGVVVQAAFDHGR